MYYPDDYIYQLRVELKNSKPCIWRRVQVQSCITLPRLHKVLQAIMGWWDYHLYLFSIGPTEYSEPDPDGLFEFTDVRYVRLNKVAPRTGMAFIYEYDFGDGWEHIVSVESAFPPAAGIRYPVCTGGERACPHEDSGGISGHERILRILRRGRDQEYRDTRTWLGEDYDPGAFSVEEANSRLERIRKVMERSTAALSRTKRMG
ncbi:MAG: plasmid pRiA4b ORF-3 family protein [Firmicutes bacterium]|nr:plasmid pRiA4b ORF-3 family protein [Bacillota bacterium]